MGAFHLQMSGSDIGDARIAFGGMAATPKRAVHTEAALRGQVWNERAVGAAQAALENDFTPISDMRASAHYRLSVAKSLLSLAACMLKQAEPVSKHAWSDYGAALMSKLDAGAASSAGRADHVRGAAHQELRHDSAQKHVTGEATYIDNLPEPAGLLTSILD